MTYYILKVVLSAVIIVAVSETAKRSTTLGALLASLPLVSVLGMIWLHVETGDNGKVADLAAGIFWLVLPSLALFLVLPPLLRAGWNFWVALGAAALLTIGLYLFQLWLLPRLGVKV